MRMLLTDYITKKCKQPSDLQGVKVETNAGTYKFIQILEDTTLKDTIFLCTRADQGGSRGLWHSTTALVVITEKR